MEILGDYSKVKKLPVRGPVFDLKVMCHLFPDSDEKLPSNSHISNFKMEKRKTASLFLIVKMYQ